MRHFSAGSLIARGNGRSYGDAALNRELTVSMLAMDRLLAFDEQEPRLVQGVRGTGMVGRLFETRTSHASKATAATASPTTRPHQRP